MLNSDILLRSYFAYFFKEIEELRKHQTNTSNNITSINFHFLHCIVYSHFTVQQICYCFKHNMYLHLRGSENVRNGRNLIRAPSSNDIVSN